jgi:hypothetical protein
MPQRTTVTPAALAAIGALLGVLGAFACSHTDSLVLTGTATSPARRTAK